MTSLQDVFSAAEADFISGHYLNALRGYVRIVQADPQHARARYRIADSVLNLGERQEAKEVYKNLAWYHIKSGQPLLGLVLCKMVLALDPNYTDLLHIFAELYSSESDRVADIDIPPLPDLSELPAPDPVDLSDNELSAHATRLAADTEAIAKAPGKLPIIPLFSHLSEEAFIKVLGSLRLRRHTDGDQIIIEGQPGDSFFMLADGVVVVSKKVEGNDAVLAHLHQGAVFGEMALVANTKRAATVSAMGDVDLLELSRHDLEEHAGELESVKVALKKFTRGRFLANLAATSPLFRPLSKRDRRALMAMFKSKKVHAQDILIEEGVPGRGLFLILRGEVQVTKEEAGQALDVAILRGGHVFGEISLLHDAPTTASVLAKSAGEVLFLSKDDFNEMLVQYPQVRATLLDLSEERLRDLREHVTGDLITDDARLLL